MKLSLLIVLSMAAFLYQIEHSKAIDLSKIGTCISMNFIQKTTVNCQREFYKSLHDDPSQNCSALAMTMIPSCLNTTIVRCMLDAMAINITMLPAGSIPSTVGFVSDPHVFCDNIVPVMIEPVTNCSLGYFIAQALCVIPFQQKFKANKADPRLCGAYSVQMNCLKTSMMASCETEAVQNLTTTYSYLFEKEGNPFFFGDSYGCSSASNLFGTSILIAFCVLFMQFLV